MFQKLKELSQSKELIDEILKKLEENKNLISELNSFVTDTKKDLESIKKENLEFKKEFKENINSLEDIKKRLNDEIDNLRSLRISINHQLPKEIKQEIDKKLEEYTKELKVNNEKYTSSEEKLSLTAKNLEQAKEQLYKLIEIISQIKSKDIEFSNSLQKIKAMENDKYELQKKVGILEKLVANRRRSN